MHVHIIVHEPFEQPANILEWATERAHTVSLTQIYDGETLPDVETVDMLVVMGGGMSVHDTDTLPWLVDEKRFIAQAVAAGKATLGICLGAQLLAEVLGGEVKRNEHTEIGWYPIRMTATSAPAAAFAGFPSEFPAFHWHGETFSLPPGAVHAATSDACENQAFVFHEKAVGLQFHIETSRDSMRDLIHCCNDQIQPGEFIQTAEGMQGGEALIEQARALLFTLLDNLEHLTRETA